MIVFFTDENAYMPLFARQQNQVNLLWFLQWDDFFLELFKCLKAMSSNLPVLIQNG